MWYWNGELVAPETGSYELMVQTDGPVATIHHDGKRVLFNDGGVLSNASLIPTGDGLRNAALTLQLQAGEHYPLRIEAWTGDNNPVQLRLAWLTPSLRQASIDAAVQAASTTKTALVFAHVEGTEGGDHKTLSLPGYQNDLITALTQRTDAKVVVVLNTGAPVTMPWIDDVASVLQMWYPGQAGGEAAAQLLLGEANPSGKLPVSFPRSEADIAVNDPLRYPGVNNQQQYSEGLLMGYRWYDARNIDPLFAFGHGLAYTTYDYSDIAVERRGDEVSVSFTLRNSGQRTGTETPQVYLEQPDTGSISTEVRKLVAFGKVTLKPGESRRVVLTAPARSFQYWNTEQHQWSVLGGNKLIHVGASSRDLRLQADLLYSPRQ
jgi:beta-glucosidase